MPVTGSALLIVALIAIGLWTGSQIDKGARYIYAHTIGKAVHLIHHPAKPEVKPPAAK